MIDPKTVIEQRYLTALERTLEGQLPETWQKLPAPDGVRRAAAAVSLRLAGQPTVAAMLAVLDQAITIAEDTTTERKADGEPGTGERGTGERGSVRQQTETLWRDLRRLLEPFAEPDTTEAEAPEPPELLADPGAKELVPENLGPLRRLARATASPRLGPELRRQIVVRLLRARARVWADEARDEERASALRRPANLPTPTPREERP